MTVEVLPRSKTRRRRTTPRTRKSVRVATALVQRTSIAYVNYQEQDNRDLQCGIIVK